jgi:hypothetical protein
MLDHIAQRRRSAVLWAARRAPLALALMMAGACSGETRPRSGPAGAGGEGASAGSDAASDGGTGGSTGGTRGHDAASLPPASDAAPTVDDAAPRADLAAPDTAPSLPPPPGACAKLFGAGAVTDWAHYDDRGTLVYKALDARGDRIMDFSSAGYLGGGVALPEVPTVMTIGPSGGDDSAVIQAALDALAQRPLDSKGLRGALLLKAGKYTATRTINIGASGVVLRGSGAGVEGTVIDLTALSHLFLAIRGAGRRATAGAPATITDDYVPSGARSFTVNDASAFEVGDAVLVNRPVTAPWVHFMGMDTLVRSGAAQLWMAVGSVQTWERSITALGGNRVTLDIPLSDSLDAQYAPGATMQKYSFDGRLSQVGVETLRVTAPVRSAAQANDPGTGGSQLLNMTNTVDSWIKGVAGHNTVEGFHIESGTRRITVEDCAITHDPTAYFTTAAPFDYSVSGSQVLVQRSSSRGGNDIFTYATSHTPGPNVVLNFTGQGRAALQPHQRWATGLLVDNSSGDQAGTGLTAAIAFINRGTAGSGQGWSQGWSVAWNCTAPAFLIQQPPGGANWALGCTGKPSAPTGAPGVPGPPMPNGIFESMNAPVGPKSLYLAQLCERLGPQALVNIGYR